MTTSLQSSSYCSIVAWSFLLQCFFISTGSSSNLSQPNIITIRVCLFVLVPKFSSQLALLPQGRRRPTATSRVTVATTKTLPSLQHGMCKKFIVSESLAIVNMVQALKSENQT